MGRRPGRAAARSAAAALKNAPQVFDDAEDETMAEAPPSEPTSPQAAEDDEEEAAEEEEGSAAPESEAGSPASEAPEPEPEPEPVVRKRRLGRPPKNKPPGWDTGEEVRDPNTPVKRRRGGGGGRGGGRWGRRGGPSHVTQQPIDKEGNMMDVINDEVELPEDPEGETKVDKMGYLQGGRDYRCRTFTVTGRGERLYMLSTEPARCVGFRDSYLFFTKHKKLYKIIIDDDEKRDLIDRDIIPHSYKGRAIGIVTARSVFREFGAQIIVGGRRIIDDYEVAKGKADGIVEGELADPNDIVKPGEPYNKNQYVAWHGASAVYHSGAPTVPMQNGKVPDKKRRVLVTDINWQLEHAREASLFNSKLQVVRKQILEGVYDPHTNTMQYPVTMQPTHARWERVPESESTTQQPDSIFGPVKPIYSRNYMIVDTVYENPPNPHVGIPGPDGDTYDLGFNGLSNVSEDILSELPPECREAFDAALATEKKWKSSWGPEAKDTQRRDLVIDKGLISF